MFNHIPPINLIELNTTDINGKRHYITPDGDFPSITTILSSFPKPELTKWKQRVGEKEAARICKLATDRGTNLHKLCEIYLNNEEINKKEYMPDILSNFYDFKKILNNINNIYHLEAPLYSSRLKVAGRTDCIGEYNETLSIIDFKTSKREKQESWIQDYFIQGTFYALAYYELTKIKIKNIVILISVEDGEDQIFIKPISEYIKPTINKINQYYSNA